MKPLFAIVLCGLLCSGCATRQNSRPFSESEKQLFAQGIGTGAADVITTQIALASDDMVEGNPLVRELIVDHEVEFMAIKALQAVITYQMAHYTDDPGTRALILRTYFWAGAGPALWNAGLMFSF